MNTAWAPTISLAPSPANDLFYAGLGWRQSRRKCLDIEMQLQIFRVRSRNIPCLGSFFCVLAGDPIVVEGLKLELKLRRVNKTLRVHCVVYGSSCVNGKTRRRQRFHTVVLEQINLNSRSGFVRKEENVLGMRTY